MKKIYLLLLFLLPLMVTAQQAVYVRSKQVEKKGDREYLVHKVLKGQTLYAISKLYEIEIDTLFHANPEIKGGLKTGSLIYIPLRVKAPAKIPAKSITVPEEKKAIKEKKDTIKALAEVVKCDSGFHPGPFEVALMLPMYLSEMDSIPTDAVDENLTGLDLKSLRFIQFYEGALLAVDSLINMGLSLKLHVYDVGEDTSKIKMLLKNPEIKRMDLIIGLLYGSSFQKLAAFAKINKIPVVNPLSNKIQLIENNPYVYLANPTIGTMASQIAEYMAGKYADDIIILLNSGKENEKRLMKIIFDQLTEELKKIGKPANNIYLFSGEAEISKIEAVISGTTKKAIVFLSNDELFVANAMLYIKEWSQAHPIMVFGMPGWLDFKSVESKLLVDVGFHTFGTSFVDYHNQNAMRFIRLFRGEYKTEPAELAFQGFDISYYFLSSMLKFGKNFSKCIVSYPYIGMQTHYVFRQNGNNGFDNNWLNIFRIVDYQVINARD